MPGMEIAISKSMLLAIVLAPLLGAIVAFLLNKVPLLGGFLALCALVTAAAIGLLRELREDFERFFDSDALAV